MRFRFLFLFFLSGNISGEVVAPALSEAPPGDDLYIATDIPSDGETDATASLQTAMEESGKTGGVLLLPSGEYRITDTLLLKKGRRIFGIGKTRPVIVLAKNTPGWDGDERRFLLSYAPQGDLQGNDTFYSGIRDVDFRIEKGNPAASAIRYDAAQGCFLSSIDIHLSPGNNGIERLGYEISGVRVFGGDYAITGSTVSWQTMILDCHFEGQAKAAIMTRTCGPTVVRSTFLKQRYALFVEDGRVERAFFRHCRFAGISSGAFSLPAENEIQQTLNVLDSGFDDCPVLLDSRGGEIVPGLPEGSFRLARLTIGKLVSVPKEGVLAENGGRRLEGVSPGAMQVPGSDIPPLPPVSKWKNVTDLGVTGDGETDDSPALEAAMASHPVLFFPPGKYRLTRPLQLSPDTSLIGLHPRSTRFVLADASPGFTNRDRRQPMLITPSGGKNQMTGIGLHPGINPGAMGILWKAGAESYLGDFWMDWERAKGEKGIGQSVSLRIEGGGVFKNLCSSGDLPNAGLEIIGSNIPSSLYQASFEHKHGTEIFLNNTNGWNFYALQTEHTQEEGEAETSMPIRAENCRDLLFANLYLYRTSGSKRAAKDAFSGKGLGAVRFYGIQNWSLGKFPPLNTVRIEGRNAFTSGGAAFLGVE